MNEPGVDSTVSCSTCGARELVSFATCLTEGWPKHCGLTMSLVETTADIEAIVGDLARLEASSPGASRFTFKTSSPYLSSDCTDLVRYSVAPRFDLGYQYCAMCGASGMEVGLANYSSGAGVLVLCFDCRVEPPWYYL